MKRNHGVLDFHSTRFSKRGLTRGVIDRKPIYSFGKSAKHMDSIFAIQVAVDFKHSCESELEIVRHHHGSASIG